jgi:hypothetical protein
MSVIPQILPLMHERTPGKPSRAASLYTVPEFSEEKLIWPILNWVRLSCPRQCRHIRRRKPAARPGLSLPDLLVAMAILSVVLLGMMQLDGHIRGQMIRTEAALIAQQRAELAAGYALAAARGASLFAIATVQPMTTGLPAFLDNNTLSVLALFGYQTRHFDNGSARCHLRGYLATVTSPAENDFLASRFKADDGSWYQGWLGGSDAAQEGDWIWVDGPEADIRFWDADHTGSWNDRHTGGPVLDNPANNASSRAAYNSQWTSQRKDLDTSLSGDLWRHVITPKGGADLRYTNFSAGTHTSLASCYNSNSNICEPNEYGSSDEDYLQITGSTKGHGLWNDMRTDQGCIANPLYGVCGYYVEWGGRTGEAPLNLVETKRIDLAKYRNFCNTGS